MSNSTRSSWITWQFLGCRCVSPKYRQGIPGTEQHPKWPGQGRLPPGAGVLLLDRQCCCVSSSESWTISWPVTRYGSSFITSISAVVVISFSCRRNLCLGNPVTWLSSSSFLKHRNWHSLQLKGTSSNHRWFFRKWLYTRYFASTYTFTFLCRLWWFFMNTSATTSPTT